MKKAYDIQIYGIVQGIGFRPFVYGRANVWRVKGWVKNEGGIVGIHVEGEAMGIKKFVLEILQNPPSLAQIQEIKIKKGFIENHVSFAIKESKQEISGKRFLPVDLGTCEKCMEDVKNPTSNKYQYPFTNCTECGPRYTIIKKLPYDRRHTTMDEFPMCTICNSEYEDPTNRRFHAQPNCCTRCGPKLLLVDGNGKKIHSKDPIKKTAQLIAQGKIIGIKGVGGFHLCCDATNEKAVKELRRRKQRPHKPFAIMARDIGAVKEICEMTEEEERIITNAKRPIVLLSKKEKSHLSSVITPNLNKIGVMLPYTPLHTLLLNESLTYLVMTSGNISGEPICYKNQEAIDTLHGIADYFLLHNRDIHVPVDDSVVKIVHHKEVIRRMARGYGPKFFKWKEHAKQQNILGVGAQQKITLSILQDGYIHISPYIGDVEQLDTYKLYLQLIEHFQNIFRFTPSVIAHDLHPDYMSTRYALSKKIRYIPVQHHHAHMVEDFVCFIMSRFL